MAESSRVGFTDDAHASLDATAFLKTHRALVVCAREFTRLTGEIETKVAALAKGLASAPQVRVTPGRFIVQLGGVALTVAWLRANVDSVDAGRLLAIVWQGEVAPRRSHEFERRPVGAARTATSIWEQVLIASASTESDWEWCPELPGAPGQSSTELATQLVQRLQRAYADVKRAD